MKQQKKVLIIGSGFGGLGSACLLAKHGYHVELYEKNDQYGGRAGLITEDGFIFDKGPSWYMMPDVFQEFFALMDESIDDWITLERLTPSYRVFLESEPGTPYDFFSDLEKNKELFERLEPGSGPVLERFLKETQEKYEIAKHEFMVKNYDSLFDFFTFRVFRLGMRLPLFTKQSRIIEKLFNHELLRKVMQYQTVLLGTAPGDTPGIYSLMNYVDFGLGVWYPQGGIYTIIEALVTLAKKHGVIMHTRAPVQKILVHDGHASGIVLADGRTIMGDIVISNTDIHHTETVLLEEQYRDHDASFWNKQLLAPSAFILYLGIKGSLPTLKHHTLIFSQEWDKNFDQIFHHPEWPHRPSLYICAPSKTDTSVAPENCENLFVLVPIAAGLDDADEAFLDEYEQHILDYIGEMTNTPDLETRILVKKRYTIKDFIHDYNAFRGTALGLAHTLSQTAIFRPNNYSRKVKNLFFVGAGTNPGIGMPICLLSAELVFKRIEGITHPHPLTPEEVGHPKKNGTR